MKTLITNNESLSDAKDRIFNSFQFDHCIPPCSRTDMNEDFLDKLTLVAVQFDYPLTLNCAYRSRDYDLKKGRSGKSYHTLGRAADIRCTDSQARYELIELAYREGLNGIGVYKSFIHLDDRTNRCLWYGE